MITFKFNYFQIAHKQMARATRWPSTTPVSKRPTERKTTTHYLCVGSPARLPPRNQLRADGRWNRVSARTAHRRINVWHPPPLQRTPCTLPTQRWPCPPCHPLVRHAAVRRRGGHRAAAVAAHTAAAASAKRHIDERANVHGTEGEVGAKQRARFEWRTVGTGNQGKDAKASAGCGRT